MSPPRAPDITVQPVRGHAALERFIRLPERLLRGDPAWVPPLRLERRRALSPRHNPWFQHGEAQFWIARRGGREVGRISAQRDRMAPDDEGRVTAQFGLLAAEDDADVFAALLGRAETWARERGARTLLGPFSLSVNEQTGLLVAGFGDPPMLMTPHDPAYAGPRVEAQGYTRARDLLAYLCDIATPMPPAASRLIGRGLPQGVTLRPLRRARLEDEIRTLIDIFNDAWAENWRFQPFTRAEVAHLAHEMRPLLQDRLVWFAEMTGRPVGFAVCLPDLNEALRDLSGRLLPFGWARLLWRLKVRGLVGARVPLMGVRRAVGAGMLGRLIPLFLVDALRREALARGIRRIEMSWILEDNAPMRALAQALGGRPYKTWRVYRKDLGP